MGRITTALIAGCLVAACAAQPPIAPPRSLPFHAYDQGFELQWAIERSSDVVRAVWTVSIPRTTVTMVTLNFFGLYGEGRIVSRGIVLVHGPFGDRSQPFSAQLRPDSREVRFELRVAMVQEGGLTR